MTDASLSLNAKREKLALLVERDRRRRNNQITKYYPDEGPLRRQLYAKHMAFFAAGQHERERAMIAANRVGKTEGAGGYEVTLHLTGLYPAWWQGRRFPRPPNFLAAGDTGTTTRDIIQGKLLGPPGQFGTGLIPADCIIKTTPKPGIPDGVDMVHIRHQSGGVSILQFRSFDQGRKAFQGTERDGIWLDEEPPGDVYTECLYRTTTTNGMVLCTFTPLSGASDVVLSYMPELSGMDDGTKAKWSICVGWDDVPHIDEATKAELIAATPVHERDARTRGIPSLGSGMIYRVPEERYLVEADSVKLSPFWPRAFGLDVGWNRTAAVWGAWDPQSDTVYIYSEHYVAQAEPAVHAAAINSRGAYIPGAIDPASAGASQSDGKRLIEEYSALIPEIYPADNSVEAGILAVYRRLTEGRLKIMANCVNLLAEMRVYRRDENGRIVKKNDHAVDALRYLIQTGLQYAQCPPDAEVETRKVRSVRNTHTGY